MIRTRLSIGFWIALLLLGFGLLMTEAIAFGSEAYVLRQHNVLMQVATSTPTATRTSTFTRTPTNTRTRTRTPTNTFTRTYTRTVTNTRTVTPTRTKTRTPTQTRTFTNTVTRTRTPTPTNTRTPPRDCTNGAGDYYVETATATIIAGDVSLSMACDDCQTPVAIPFTFQLYGQNYTTVNVESNGVLIFSFGDGHGLGDCNPNNLYLPSQFYGASIMPLWDDLRTDSSPGCTGYAGDACGIFKKVEGSSPNRILDIEWRAVFNQFRTQKAHFEVRLYETDPDHKFTIIYDDVYGGGGERGQAPTPTPTIAGGFQDVGASIGVQRSGNEYASKTNYACCTGLSVLGSTTMLTFKEYSCGPTYTPTRTSTPRLTFTSTRTRSATFTRSPTRTITPTPTPTSGACTYSIATATATAVAATNLVADSQCDDCTVDITIPFNYSFFGNVYTAITANANGGIEFGTAEYSGACLPHTAPTILGYWTDLDMSGVGNGIFTSTSGSTPNQIFNIRWKGINLNNSDPIEFEMRLYENAAKVDIIYTDANTGGANATIGLENDGGTVYVEFLCNTDVLLDGDKLTFTYTC